jgi:hypothetical protein
VEQILPSSCQEKWNNRKSLSISSQEEPWGWWWDNISLYI